MEILSDRCLPVRSQRMIQSPSVASSLPPATRQQLAVDMLSKTESVSRMAEQHEVSRKFLYQQKEKASEALEQAFALPSRESEVLFYLPVTHTWLYQLILGLILICHASYRGVVELLRDLFDWSISASTVHNRVKEAAQRAECVNQREDLSGIRVGLPDEIFQAGQPVLAGVCAHSTYCYLLVAAENRNGETWGWHLLEASERGLCPEYTIADGGHRIAGRSGTRLAGDPLPWRYFSRHQRWSGLSQIFNQKSPNGDHPPRTARTETQPLCTESA